MKYILYTEKPEGNPTIGDGSLLMPIQCEEGWFISIEHKEVAESVGWDGIEVKEVTFEEYE